MRVFYIFSATVLFLFGAYIAPANAQTQDLSKSLTECALVFEVNKSMALSKGKSAQDVRFHDEAVSRFLNAAVTQSEKEGQPEPKTHIKSLYTEMSPKWAEKYAGISDFKTAGSAIKNTKEIMDWIGYCGSLGKKIGILPIK